MDARTYLYEKAQHVDKQNAQANGQWCQYRYPTT